MQVRSGRRPGKIPRKGVPRRSLPSGWEPHIPPHPQPSPVKIFLTEQQIAAEEWRARLLAAAEARHAAILASPGYQESGLAWEYDDTEAESAAAWHRMVFRQAPSAPATVDSHPTAQHVRVPASSDVASSMPAAQMQPVNGAVRAKRGARRLSTLNAADPAPGGERRGRKRSRDDAELIADAGLCDDDDGPAGGGTKRRRSGREPKLSRSESLSCSCPDAAAALSYASSSQEALSAGLPGGAPFLLIKDVPQKTSDSAPAGVIEAAEIQATPLPRGASNRHASAASGRSTRSAACAVGVPSAPPGVDECAAPAPMDCIPEAARASGGVHGDEGVMGSPEDNIAAPSKIVSRTPARKVHNLTSRHLCHANDLRRAAVCPCDAPLHVHDGVVYLPVRVVLRG